jgi:hypothetical protein
MLLAKAFKYMLKLTRAETNQPTKKKRKNKRNRIGRDGKENTAGERNQFKCNLLFFSKKIYSCHANTKEMYIHIPSVDLLLRVPGLSSSSFITYAVRRCEIDGCQ